MPSLHPLFSQSIRAGRRSAMYGRKQIIISCAKRTTDSALRKSGKKNGRRMRRRKRGRELVRVAFQAHPAAVPRAFRSGGHFWRHLLVTKGGKNCSSQETPNRRMRDASQSKSKNRFFLRKKCIPAGRNPLKYDFKRFALRTKPEERQHALRKQPCRTVKIRPQTDISD